MAHFSGIYTMKKDDPRIEIVIVILFLFFFWWLLSGCTGFPIQRSESASVKAAENIAAKQALMIESAVRSQPIFTNTLYESRTVVKHDADQSAGSTENRRFESSQYIPWGVSLFLIGAGGLLVVRLLSTIRKTSRAAAAALDGADALAAGIIRSLRSRVAQDTDASRQAALQEIISQTESERGKLRTRTNGA